MKKKLQGELIEGVKPPRSRRWVRRKRIQERLKWPPPAVTLAALPPCFYSQCKYIDNRHLRIISMFDKCIKTPTVQWPIYIKLEWFFIKFKIFINVAVFFLHLCLCMLRWAFPRTAWFTYLCRVSSLKQLLPQFVLQIIFRFSNTNISFALFDSISYINDNTNHIQIL